MTTVHAHLRYLRIAPRKVRLVIDLVRGLPVELAIDQLSMLPKRSSLPVMKLLKSAMANATNNHGLDGKTLRISKIIANEGPSLKRFTQKAYGRANPILKRTTHVSIWLEGQELKGAKPVKKEAAPDKVKLTVLKKTPATPAKKTSKVPASKGKSTDAVKKHGATDSSAPRQGTE